MTDPLEQRLADIESRLAHHERAVEDLSDVVVTQHRTIERLEARLRRLAERQAETEAGWSPSPADDRPPPHY